MQVAALTALLAALLAGACAGAERPVAPPTVPPVPPVPASVQPAAEAAAPAEPAAPQAVAEPPAAAAAGTPTAADLEGLYAGAIVYQPGAAELEALVELSVDAEGKLVGTIDMAAFDMLYHPLEDFRFEEDGDLYFAYRRFSEVRGPDALFEFEARLAEDGALVGEFLESRGRIPFRFERIGDAGTPRPELTPRPLADLSPAGGELRTAFNEDEDRVRLILLLSPT